MAILNGRGLRKRWQFKTRFEQEGSCERLCCVSFLVLVFKPQCLSIPAFLNLLHYLSTVRVWEGPQSHWEKEKELIEACSFKKMPRKSLETAEKAFVMQASFPMGREEANIFITEHTQLYA